MHNRTAVSPMIAMVLLLTIIVVASAGILLWALPTTQRYKNEIAFTYATNNFKKINQALKDALYIGNNYTKTGVFEIQSGSFYVEKNYEIFALWYSNNSIYNVKFRRLEDRDNNTLVNITPYMVIYAQNVTGYIIANGSKESISVVNVTTTTLNGVDYFSITFNRTITDAIHINITTTNFITHLYFFELNSLSFIIEAEEIYELRLMNSGIFGRISDSYYFIEKPLFKLVDDILIINVVEMIFSGISSGTSGSYKYSISPKIFVRDVCEAYNTTIYTYHKNNNWNIVWNHIAKNVYFEINNETVLHESVTLKLIQTIVNFEIFK